MITTKNKIGYIQRRYDENNVPHFKFIVAKIKRVNIGVKSTKVYTKEFYPLDLEDLESTTEMFDTSKGIIIVQEPFILKELPFFKFKTESAGSSTEIFGEAPFETSIKP